MSEVIGKHVESFEQAKEPGDFFWAKQDKLLHFLCPCGCGKLAGVTVKPKVATGWEWNGSVDKPTVRPSIAIDRGHWHGYLTDGVFRSC